VPHDPWYHRQLEAIILLTPGYHASRLPIDPKRDVVWRALWRYHFRHEIKADDCVLDLGCGYGNFINQVVARRRFALDVWPEFPSHLAPGVEPIVGCATVLGPLPDHAVDFAFASNLFEHLQKDEFARVLSALRDKLSDRGRLTIMQPNYRYAYREYFDDYTHVTVWSHISLAEFLVANGYDVLSVVPRFMPITINSGWPVSPWLIRAWLASPVRIFGKQMLLTAKPRS
jgi:SAM-dependent methyltransferase